MRHDAGRTHLNFPCHPEPARERAKSRVCEPSLRCSRRQTDAVSRVFETAVGKPSGSRQGDVPGLICLARAGNPGLRRRKVLRPRCTRLRMTDVRGARPGAATQNAGRVREGGPVRPAHGCRGLRRATVTSSGWAKRPARATPPAERRQNRRSRSSQRSAGPSSWCRAG